MAKAVLGPILWTYFNSIPIYVTYKTVKNYNFTFRKNPNKISMSVPLNSTKKEIDESIVDMSPKIRKYYYSAPESRSDQLDKQTITYVKGIPVKVKIRKKLKQPFFRVQGDFIELVTFPGPTKEDLVKVVNKNPEFCNNAANIILEKRSEKTAPINFVTLFGKRRPVIYDSSEEIEYRDGKFHVPEIFRSLELREIFIEEIDQVITKILESYATKRIQAFEKEMDLKVKSIEIKKYISRWGSCYPSKGLIKLNFYLATIDKKYIDIVIRHEMCHLKEQNHSKSFYSLLKKFCPDYKEFDQFQKEILLRTLTYLHEYES